MEVSVPPLFLQDSAWMMHHLFAHPYCINIDLPQMFRFDYGLLIYI